MEINPTSQETWKPHPKQERALLSDCFETLFGGARSGGKTDAGMAWLLYLKDSPRAKGLVIRRNYTDLKDWLDRAKVMYSGSGAIFTGSVISFPSGYKIICGHLKDVSSYTKYQGHEYQRILIEELTQIPIEDTYLKLIASCRSTIPNIKPQVFATSNPGGVGHTWVKRRFVDPSVPGKPFTDEISGRTRVYIPATVEDNPVLLERDPGYVKYLESLPPDLRAQWRYGDWTTAKVRGAFFEADIEQANKEGRISKVLPFPYEPVSVAWDLGVLDQQIAIFYQIKGFEIRILDCYDDNHKSFEFYPQMLAEKGYKYLELVLPHDGNKRAADSLRSFRDVLEAKGFVVRVNPRTKDKRRDIQRAREILPRCFFDSESCSRLLEALSLYRREWIEERGMFTEDPYHDWTSHYADAFMALACSLPDSLKTSEAAYNQAVNRLLNPSANNHNFNELGTPYNSYRKEQQSLHSLLSRSADIDGPL